MKLSCNVKTSTFLHLNLFQNLVSRNCCALKNGKPADRCNGRYPLTVQEQGPVRRKEQPRKCVVETFTALTRRRVWPGEAWL